MEHLLALPLALVSFALQIRPRLGNRYFGVDTWRHLAVADFYRQGDSEAELARYLIQEPSDYPPILRWLLSLAPRDWVERNQWLICPAIDIIHNILLFVVAYSLTGHIGAALVAQAAYMLAPLIVMENSSLTTRPLASLEFTVVMLAGMAFVVSDSWWWLPSSIIAASVLFLTHRMGIQALTALTVILTIWYRTPYFVVAQGGAWLLALAVSRGFYWRVFTGHMAMLNWWRGNIHNRYAHQIRGLPKRRDESADPVFKIYQIVRRAPFIAVFAANPFVLFALALTFDRAFGWGWTSLPDWDAELEFALVWSVGLLAVGMAVRQLRFIEFVGEGERYGEYAAFPVALVVATFLWTVQSDWQWLAWLGFGLIAMGGGLAPALYLQQKVVAHDADRSLTPELREVLAEVDMRPTQAQLMTIPLSLADFALYFTRNSRVLSTDSSFGHLRHYSDFFPVLRVPLVEICARYGINALLINEGYVRLDELHLSEGIVVKRAGRFCLIAVHPAAARHI